MKKGACAEEQDMQVFSTFINGTYASLYRRCMATYHAYHAQLLILDVQQLSSLISRMVRGTHVFFLT
jgi:hypothetical protein